MRRTLIAGIMVSAALTSTLPGQTPEAPEPQIPDPQVRLEAARKLVASGEFQQAKIVLTSYLPDNEQSVEGHTLMAFTLERLNDPAGSLTEYTRAAALQRPSAFDLENVARDYVLLNDLPAGEHWARVATELDPHDAEAWYVLGRIRFTLQRFEEAANCFTQSLALQPKSVKAENNLGLSYEGLNRLDDAVAAYREAIQWQRNDHHPSEQPLLNLGIILVHQAKFEEAQNLLTEAAAIAPDDVRIREELGHLFLERKMLTEAEGQLQTAIRLAPDKASLHFLLGKVFHLEGKEDLAKAQFALSSTLSGYHATPENQ